MLYSRNFLVPGTNRKLVRTFRTSNAAGPVRREARMMMAAVTVKKTAALRDLGLNVPQMSIPVESPEFVVHDVVGGERFDELSPAAAQTARTEMTRYLALAETLATSDRDSRLKANWLVNRDLGVFRFHKDGTVKVWLDPVVPMGIEQYQGYLPSSM